MKFALLFAIFIQSAAMCAMGLVALVLPATKVVPSQSQSQEAKVGRTSQTEAKPEPGNSTAEMRPTQGTSSEQIRAGLTAGNRSALRIMATRSATRCRVPVDLFHRLVFRESSWRPFVVSSAGAVGPAQVLPIHAGQLLDVADPETNLSLGACLLRRHFDRFGSWRIALHAYHAGGGAVSRNEIGSATVAYAAGIMSGGAQ